MCHAIISTHIHPLHAVQQHPVTMLRRAFELMSGARGFVRDNVARALPPRRPQASRTDRRSATGRGRGHRGRPPRLSHSSARC
jgi:hypothetical protein